MPRPIPHEVAEAGQSVLPDAVVRERPISAPLERGFAKRRGGRRRVPTAVGLGRSPPHDGPGPMP